MRVAASYGREATGYLTTAARAVPFLTEAGAGFSAGVRSLDDLLSGRTPDPAANWTRARAEQQGVVDLFQREHPVWSNNATGLGTVAPMVLGGLGAGRVARSVTSLAPAAVSNLEAVGSRAVAKKALATTARNAFTGAGVGALYGAARPGDSQQRAQYALDALAPGALWGAAVPFGVGAGAKSARALASAIGKTATGAGALGSELADTLRRAATGRTPVDQSRPTSILADWRGEADAVRLLRQMGVSPEALEQARSLAQDKPITTAEAIGLDGMELAQGLRGRAGTTDAVANSVLGARADARPDRVLNDTHEATQVHPLSIMGDLGQLLADSRERGETYFDKATSLPVPGAFQLRWLAGHPEARPYWDAAIKNTPNGMLFDFGDAIDREGKSHPQVIPTIRFTTH